MVLLVQILEKVETEVAHLLLVVLSLAVAVGVLICLEVAEAVVLVVAVEKLKVVVQVLQDKETLVEVDILAHGVVAEAVLKMVQVKMEAVLVVMAELQLLQP